MDTAERLKGITALHPDKVVLFSDASWSYHSGRGAVSFIYSLGGRLHRHFFPVLHLKRHRTAKSKGYCIDIMMLELFGILYAVRHARRNGAKQYLIYTDNEACYKALELSATVANKRSKKILARIHKETSHNYRVVLVKGHRENSFSERVMGFVDRNAQMARIITEEQYGPHQEIAALRKEARICS